MKASVSAGPRAGDRTRKRVDRGPRKVRALPGWPRILDTAVFAGCVGYQYYWVSFNMAGAGPSGHGFFLPRERGF